MDDMNKSIDDILISIESNQQAINDMLTAAKENNTRISGAMQRFASSHSCLNKEQMTAYAEYARAYENIRRLYSVSNAMPKVDSINKIHNAEIAYTVLDEMHTKQLTFMDMICTVLEKAGAALKILCRD